MWFKYAVRSVFAVHSMSSQVPGLLFADSEDSAQTVWMCRLIYVIAGNLCNFLMLQLICVG